MALATQLRPPRGKPPEGLPGSWIAGGVALVLLLSAFVPLAVVTLGVVIVALALLDAGFPGLLGDLRTLIGLPVGQDFEEGSRLLPAWTVGVLLVLCGTAGAGLSGQLRAQRMLRHSQRLAAEDQLTGKLERSKMHLATGDVESAERTLMGALEVSPIPSERRREIDELLARIRRSGDAEVIREVLLRLPEDQFEAFARGDSVPRALEFPERVLTSRAVALARAQVDEVRAER